MAEPVVLDPTVEFDDEGKSIVEPVVKEPSVAAGASSEEVAKLRADFAESLKTIEALRSDTAVVGKLKELFAGTPEDPKDAFVKKEIQRLVPGLDDIAKIKEILPYILNALNLDAEEKVAERAETALDVVKDLMAEVGLDAKDDDLVGDMEELLARRIKNDPDLLRQWNRGNVKNAVTKAFEKASTKLFAPTRLKAKRSAVSTITESPKSSPKGGPAAPAPGDNKKLDFKDTSRDNVKKIHEAAFERLQELTEE